MDASIYTNWPHRSTVCVLCECTMRIVFVHSYVFHAHDQRRPCETRFSFFWRIRNLSQTHKASLAIFLEWNGRCQTRILLFISVWCVLLLFSGYAMHSYFHRGANTTQISVELITWDLHYVCIVSICTVSELSLRFMVRARPKINACLRIYLLFVGVALFFVWSCDYFKSLSRPLLHSRTLPKWHVGFVRRFHTYMEWHLQSVNGAQVSGLSGADVEYLVKPVWLWTKWA